MLALAGGVGGELAAGLSHWLGERLTALVNTGDDFEHLRLHVVKGLAIKRPAATIMGLGVGDCPNFAATLLAQNISKTRADEYSRSM